MTFANLFLWAQIRNLKVQLFFLMLFLTEFTVNSIYNEHKHLFENDRVNFQMPQDILLVIIRNKMRTKPNSFQWKHTQH